MSLNVSILIKGFPAILAASGVACIWLGLQHDHVGVLILGLCLFIASIGIYYDYLQDMKEIAMEKIHWG